MKDRWIIGCEESQAITIAMRKLGIEAFSNDLKPAGGGHPEWHIQGDVFEVIKSERFNKGIFHPSFTFLANSGSQWLSHPEDKHLPFDQRRPNPFYPNRREDQKEAIDFAKRLYSLLTICALENPIGVLSKPENLGKPTQIINPYQFGDEATKTTCLWLRGLPLLTHTDIVGKGERTVFKSGKSMPTWYLQAAKHNAYNRSEIRSKTFPGIANAMAEQWGLGKNTPGLLF